MRNKYFHKVLSLLTALVVLFGILPIGAIPVAAAITSEFAGGSGTEEDPYLIETKEHLNNVRNYLDAHYKMIADIVFTDADFSVNGDFYNDGKGWNPIGVFGSGNINVIFDGHGHTITGLYSKQDAVYVGLFSGNKGIIKDLKILDAEISVIRDSAYIGTLAGTNSGEIVNCYVSGNVSGESNQVYTEIYVGGIVGRNAGCISYCSNNGTITAIANKSSTDAYAGGISGYSYDDSISFCKNYGTILSSGGTRYTYAGGITGENYYSNIISCINFGSVTASGSYSHAGGITSNTYGNITSCYNTGIVCAIGSSPDKQDIAGGIAADNYGTISKSYNGGSVSGIYVGGIAGRNRTMHIVTNCYNTAEISASRGTFAYLGGIVGNNMGVVKFNYNVGKIKSGFYSAGVVGENGTDGEVSACYYLNTCASGGIDAGTGETTACNDSQLKLASTFVGFDFESVWELAEGNMYLYPILKSARQYVPNENYRFTIVFYDDDGSVISENQYSYGEMIAEPAAPTKVADNTYTYTFAGWDKEVVICTGNTTYTATYTPSYINYTIEFKNWNGDTLALRTYHWGDAVITPNNPIREKDSYYIYTFAGWDKEVTNCKGNAVYQAMFASEHYHSYTNIATVPSCTTQGYTTHTCLCGDAYVDSYVNTLGHSFTNYKSNSDATCTEDGTETAKCDRCDVTDTRTVVGSAKGHSHTKKVTKPTCTSKGYTTYTCSCGDTYKANYTNALGHSYKSGSCTRCKYKPAGAKITAQPVNVAVKSGKTAKVTVKATGSGLKYQWYYAQKGAKTYTKASTTNSFSVKMSTSYNGTKAYCVVTDQYGNSVKSNVVTLYKGTHAKITTQPKGITVANGKTGKLELKASGSSLKYQWYVKYKGASSFTKVGKSSKTYSFKMADKLDGAQAYCVVKDKYGVEAKSSVVTIKLAPQPKITTQPKNVTVTKGKTAKVTLKATGDGLKYTWYYAKSGSSKFKKASGKSATYSVKMSASVNGRRVYCVVTDKYGNTVKSSIVTLKMK